MNFKETGYNYVDQIRLSQDTTQWWTLVNTELNLRAGLLLTDSTICNMNLLPTI